MPQLTYNGRRVGLVETNIRSAEALDLVSVTRLLIAHVRIDLVVSRRTVVRVRTHQVGVIDDRLSQSQYTSRVGLEHASELDLVINRFTLCCHVALTFHATCQLRFAIHANNQ